LLGIHKCIHKYRDDAGPVRDAWRPVRGDRRGGVVDRAAAGRVRARTINLIGVSPSATTYLTVYPGDAAYPPPSTVSEPTDLSVAAGATVDNLDAVVPVGPDGTIQIWNYTGNIRVVVEIVGHYD
jgi:hypothetical protein